MTNRMFNPDPEPAAWMPWQEHSQESQDGAVSLKPFVWNLREKVYAAIKSYGLSGLTSQQVEIVTELSGNTVRPRIVELAREGRIIPAGTRKTASNRDAQVWVIGEAL